MTTVEAEALLDLHRQLCAAVRNADQVLSRLYVADPNSDEAKQAASRYRAALARARAALRALEDMRLGADESAADTFKAMVETARRIC